MQPAAALLDWYLANRRALPWRGTGDPYAILVSEVMLQQTRVETAVPYYQRFLARFPTVAALAGAPEDAVLAAWSGLGYYRRARNLQAAARTVVARGGELPRTAAELARLPGIGPYTAAAVASIAFGEEVPVVDGNVARVLSRLRAESYAVHRAAGRRALVEAARALLLPGRAGDGNQALMELGATLCTPRRPRCSQCPLAEVCVAGPRAEAELYPEPRRRVAPRLFDLVVAVAEQEGRVLLFRRPEDGAPLGGMWELPSVPRPARGGLARELAARYGGSWRLSAAQARVRHRITFRDLRVEVRRARYCAAGAVGEGPEAAWLTAAERARWPVGALVAKALGALGRRGREPQAGG